MDSIWRAPLSSEKPSALWREGHLLWWQLSHCAMTHLCPHTVFPVPGCLLLMNGSGLATVHPTFTNDISVNICATAEAKFKRGCHEEYESFGRCVMSLIKGVCLVGLHRKIKFLFVYEKNENNYLCKNTCLYSEHVETRCWLMTNIMKYWI